MTRYDPSDHEDVLWADPPPPCENPIMLDWQDYGAGLRLLECLRLRVKDIGFDTNQIVVREGKGNKDRLTMLPAIVKAPLMSHLVRVRILYQQHLECGFGRVYLPDALRRKYPSAEQEWG